MKLWQGVIARLAAGAAGTTALNVVTYLDMAVRGRSPGSTPVDTVEKLAAKTRSSIPGDRETRQNQLSEVALTGPTAGLESEPSSV
jgi:hypothetical protein